MANTNKKHRLVAYIDESGDPGSKYGKGSSEFLAIGAVVFAVDSSNEVLTVFDAARKERGSERVFRKFCDSSDKDNFVLTKHLSARPVRTVMVGLHKPSMVGSHSRSNPQAEYQYLVKFALERISWIARDSAKRNGDGNKLCRLIFSQQKMYPYEDLCAYLDKLKNGQGKYNCSAEWDYIDEEIEVIPHENEQPIHLADIVASSFHRAIETKKHGMTDDRFARNLFPSLYRRDKKCYGLKLFPSKEVAEMTQAGRFDFLKMLS